MIEYLSLQKVTQMHADEIEKAVRTVVESGWYLQGNAVKAFEDEYAKYIGTRYCVSCANGLDALTLIFRAYIEMGVMKPGDEVIVPANTYIASILAITENGLKPILVDPWENTMELNETLIEKVITERTRAIMLVHLYGRCAFKPAIHEICSRRHLKLIEDNAQAHGCRYENLRTGALGDAAGHSFYPGKNLGALGDAGAVTTDNGDLANIIRSLANYGSSCKYVFPYQGRNSRMDEIQAAVLSVKLKYLDADNARRKEIADYYDKHIKHKDINIPHDILADNVYHIYPILCTNRDALQQYLKEKGIQTQIHYPIPPHKQECYKEWNALSLPVTERIHQQELSLPCNQTMTDEEVEYITATINGWQSSLTTP